MWMLKKKSLKQIFEEFFKEWSDAGNKNEDVNH